MRFDPQSNYVPESEAPAGAGRQSRLSARSGQLGALCVLILLGGGAVGGAFVFMAPAESSASEDASWMNRMSASVRAAMAPDDVASPTPAVEPAPSRPAPRPVPGPAPDDPTIASPAPIARDVAPEPAEEPDDPSADAYAAARVLAGMGRHREAIDQLDRLLADAPDHVDALYLLGLEACRIRDYDTAQRAHDRLLRVDVRQARLLSNLLRPRRH